MTFRPVPILVVLVSTLLMAPTSAASDGLSTQNDTPFPSSTVITGAQWTSTRSGPPANQFGDILSASSLASGSLYLMMDDGGTGTRQPARWRNSVARVAGNPPNLSLTPVGDAVGRARTPLEVQFHESRLTGPLGSAYSTGLTAVGGVLYATRVRDWNWNANGLYRGLTGIAYSTDGGRRWRWTSRSFPAATGNLNFVQYSSGASAPDGYVYAMATEREFNASTMILGRTRADTADITDPSHWQWAAGSRTVDGQTRRMWTSSISGAQPVLRWKGHLTYPRMSYDAPLHRYLLTFTYAYSSSTPALWRDGSELVVLESPTPAGPFSFVARQSGFGPSNGYDPALPVSWMSADGTGMWMLWAANFAGCAPGLDCSGGYGLNLRRLKLTVTPGFPSAGARTVRLQAGAMAGRCRRGQSCPPPRRRRPATYVSVEPLHRPRSPDELGEPI